MVNKNPIGKFAIGVFYCLFFLNSNQSVNAEPFLTTNQNPFSLINGLPLPVSAALPEKNSKTYNLALEITNTLNSESKALESIILDFESYQLKTSFVYGLSEDWAVKAYLPFIYRGGGIFDNAIDSWHDFFGLPRANRPLVANNHYQIQYIKNGTTLVDLTQASNQLGDIQLSLGRQLSSTIDFNSSLWATIELPTGDVTNLSGNKGIDYSLTLATDKQLNSDWRLWSNAGILLPGRSFNTAVKTKSQVGFVYLGLSWAFMPELDLQLQLNGHTDFYEDSTLRLFRKTYEFIFGGTWHLNQCSSVDIAFSEDIKVGAAPDISILLNWRNQISCY